MTLLREVIDIPESLSASDFVVGLADSVEHRRETLQSYVVTPQVAVCFNKALELVASSVRDGNSRAAFLHGSFGSGKSHFMGVLYQVLRHDADARTIEGLGEVVGKHDATLQGKNILPLTYHLIGATSLEEAILKGYVQQVRRWHPEATLPAVHRTDALLDNADQRREQDGDERFFALLNKARPATGSGFGGMGGGAASATWDAARYDGARQRPEGDLERTALVNDLVTTMFTAFADHGNYVDLDTGLAVIAEHAAALGHDAIVLFLDELILWLASHLQNKEFVTREGAKLAKLVEAQDARRAIPLVSFISRQRDITEFLGTHVPGAEKAAFSDVFGWSRGRLDDIRLEDRNLPVIVERRLLRPKDDAARAAVDRAFGELDASPEAWDVLLTGTQAEADGTGSDRASFRRTYPFSPALVSTLVSLSQALQRERTALRVMLQLLVDGRDELTLGDLVPVGDLYDVVVASSVQAVTPELGQKFELARRLYDRKLRRALLDIHQLTEEQAADLPPEHPLRVDDRLVKTLIISALAPDVPALSNLTASRLSALNHGTIKAWLPGQEVASALQKLRAVAAQVSEVHVGDGDDPLITVELTDVDPESVLERGRHVDNEGNRRLLLKELVWESLGVREQATLEATQSYDHVWRGRRTKVDLLFGNVRDAGELPESSLLAERDSWRVVVDYPFDAADQSPRSDKSRVDDMVRRGVESQTLLWVPAFFTPQRLEDLGTLVVINHLLAGDGARFREAAEDLSPTDREQVRNMLRQRQTTLRDRLVDCLKQAYGAAARAEADVDVANALDQPFLTLQPGLDLQDPVGATLADSLRHVLDQACTFTWPAHPRFEPTTTEVRVSDARRVLEWCEAAVASEGGRLPVDQASRKVLTQVAGPLEVGAMGETHFVVTPSTVPWIQRLTQRAAADGQQGTYSVRSLLSYLDQPEPRGLSGPLSGLVVHVFALLEDLVWWRDGQQVEAPPVDRVSPAFELRSPEMPEQERWEAGLATAREVLGVEAADLLTAANLTRVVTGARRAAQERLAPSGSLVRLLEQHLEDLGISADDHRARTASETRELCDALVSTVDDLRVVELLAGRQWTTSAVAARRSLESSAALVRVLEVADWEVLRLARGFDDHRREQAQSVLARLADAAKRDELAVPLGPAVSEAQTAVRNLLAQAVSSVSPTEDESSSEPTSAVAAVEVRLLDGDVDRALDELRRQLLDADAASGTIRWTADP